MVDNKENARLIAIVGLVVVMATCMACFLVVVVFNSAYGGETIALRNPFAPPTVAAPAAPASGPQYVGNKNVIPQAPRPQASATAPAPQIGDGKNVIPPRSAAAPQTPAQADPASTAPQAASSKPVRLDRAALEPPRIFGQQRQHHVEIQPDQAAAGLATRLA
ncbi:MAG: hypothetical protein AAFR56_16625, partial [Chloroflexota bacterium]